MTKIPDHNWKKAISALKAAGFKKERTTGDHVLLWKDGIVRPIVIPKDKSLPKFIVSNILRTAGLSRKKYVKLLRGEKD